MTHIEQLRQSEIFGNSGVQPSRTDSTKGKESFDAVVEELLKGYLREWDAVDTRTRALSGAMPGEMRNALELQRLAHQLALRSEIITRGAEAVTSTIKRLQSLQNG